MKRGRPALSAVLPLLVAACGSGKVPAVPIHPPAPSVAPSVKAAPPGPERPAALAGVTVGSFTEGTFGPRLVRNGRSAILVSAPRADTGRRWMAIALDEKDAPIGASKHEIAEAPEDSSAWDVKPVGDGFVLAWTRPSDSGEQLLTAALAADGSPRSAPALIAKSGDDLVAVRLTPLGEGAGAILTYGEKTIPKGGISASGTLFAIGLDALGRPGAPAPTRIADKLSAWQVASVGRDTALAAIVQRVDGKKDEKLAAREDLPRAAKIVSLAITGKGITASDAVTIAGDDVVPEIDVVATTPGRALVVWSDRRELDAHLFALPVDVSTNKPKALGPAKRAVSPRGDQAIVSLIATKTGAIVMWETVSPRSVLDPRRRFDVVRLSESGDALSTARSFWFPYENDEPELVRAGDDDVAILTYGASCFATGDAAPTCDAGHSRPWIVRLHGPTLTPRQYDVVDVSALSAPAMHAFDLACTAAHCEVLAEGSGNPATVAIARIPVHEPAKDKPRWVYRDLIEPSVAPPRLEGATAIGREAEFTGLHAARAGQGALVGWITYAPDDTDVETTVIVDNKGKKGGKPETKIAPKKPKTEGGARVAVRLLDQAGEPLSEIATITDRALSKGDVAVAWGDTGGVVAYVARADGDEEIFVARVDSKGNKSGKSSRITNAPGAASDVALAALPEGGYVLGWVEARKGGAPAVYLAKLDKSGQKVGSEVKLGGGVAGDVSDLSIAVSGSGSSGSRIVAVWSDARDDATHGYADVLFAVVGSKDMGKPLIAEKAIARTKTHSHYPVVTARGDGGALIAWVEDDPSSSEFLELIGRPEWGARFARIDAQGVVVQGATELPIDPALGRGVVTGVAIDCGSGTSSCRAVLARATHLGMSMLGTTIGSTVAVPPARVVWSWYGAPSQEVSPAIVGTAMFGCEDGLEKDDGRVRRLSVAW